MQRGLSDRKAVCPLPLSVRQMRAFGQNESIEPKKVQLWLI